jgi:surfeit locus 1 family protein
VTFRPLPILTAATVIALAILIGLGTWQLQRRAEKHELLDQMTARSSAPPAPVEILFATGDYAAFRHATADGTFDHAKESYVYAPRTDGGPTRQGFKVVTPLHLASGGTILVDRGWVPEDKKDPAMRKEGQFEDELEVTGTLRPPSTPSTFTPPPDLATRTFYLRDSAAIAAAIGVTLLRPLILEATSAIDGGPEPRTTEINIPDNHLNYALTWYSLAVVLLVIYLRFHQVRGRLRFGK